jgi:hypothetical protein
MANVLILYLSNTGMVDSSPTPHVCLQLFPHTTSELGPRTTHQLCAATHSSPIKATSGPRWPAMRDVRLHRCLLNDSLNITPDTECAV